jgi:hypothetical protein
VELILDGSLKLVKMQITVYHCLWTDFFHKLVSFVESLYFRLLNFADASDPKELVRASEGIRWWLESVSFAERVYLYYRSFAAAEEFRHDSSRLMNSIGLYDLDTTHPRKWTPMLREMGYTVSGFLDSGNIHPPDFIQRVADKHGLQRFDSAEALADANDIIILCSCDWNLHLPMAKFFLERGRGVLVDKPLAGTPQELLEMAQLGGRIFGGSSMGFEVEISDYLARPIEERGEPHTVLAGCGVDEFFYGIHLAAGACALLGSGIRRVRSSNDGRIFVTTISWTNGRQAVLTSGEHPPMKTHFTVMSEKTVSQFIMSGKNLYRSFLEKSLDYLAGKSAEPPIPLAALIEPEMAILAAKLSRQEGDRWVDLSEMRDARVSFDGTAFSKLYREGLYPPASVA